MFSLCVCVNVSTFICLAICHETNIGSDSERDTRERLRFFGVRSPKTYVHMDIGEVPRSGDV